MVRFNHFLYGFVPGLLLPVAFIWVYLNQFYPGDLSFFETLKQLYPGVLMGKLLLLSIMPNLLLVFVFYKTDSFKIAAGMMIGGMPYLIPSFFML
jgi:CDP-diglyceride synthetase